MMKFLASETHRHFVINLPPRSLKSILLSVVFPAYLLGRDPTTQILCVSYAKPLADSLARDVRAVMESDWYRRVFPDTRILRANDEGLFTTQRGFRRFTTVEGSVTGLGGDIIIADDLIQPEEARSDAIREKRNAWVASTLLSRGNDKRRSKTILVGHRVHEDDPSATMLKLPNTMHIRLPAIADDDYLLDFFFGREFEWKKGEPLQAVREPLDLLALERARQGERNFSALYLQAPVPLDGGIIKISWFQDLIHDGTGVIKFKPEGDKETRASIASDQIEQGNVFLPSQAHWLGAFQAECAAFPRGRHDDQVDSMSQAIIWNQNKKRNPVTLFGTY